VITVPLSITLIFLAGFIAQRVYHLPEITPLIQLYAASLVLLGLQDVLGATLTGMKKFISLYVVQIGTAIINVFVFAYFTWRFSLTGYFWAIIATTTVMVIWYGFIIARYLRGYLKLPSWGDLRFFARRVFRISLYMYAARILFVVWQRLPILVLAVVFSKEQLGDLALSLTFGSKLTILAMALSEVNLSMMSSLFAHNQAEFQRIVTRNMQRILFLLVLCTTVLIFFTPEILHIPILLKYLPAVNLIIVMTVAFFVYALIDIGTSSVFVAADQPRWRAVLYAVMTCITAVAIGWLVVFRPDAFLATLGVLAGALMTYILTVVIAWRRFQVALLNR
jgi:O-antigen/teichoic acid export membrane protein